MASERRVLKADIRSREKGYDALYETLHSSSAKVLNDLVKQAMGHFEAGSDPNEVYTEFDIDRLALSLAIDRRSGAEALLGYLDKPMEEKLAACMFVSMGIIALNGTDPHIARLVLAHITRKGAVDEGFSDLSKLVMLGIAQTVYSASESGENDPSLNALAEACLKRLNQ